MAGVAMLLLALVAAVAVFFVLRVEDDDVDGQHEEIPAADERELTAP